MQILGLTPDLLDHKLSGWGPGICASQAFLTIPLSAGVWEPRLCRDIDASPPTLPLTQGLTLLGVRDHPVREHHRKAHSETGRGVEGGRQEDSPRVRFGSKYPLHEGLRGHPLHWQHRTASLSVVARSGGEERKTRLVSGDGSFALEKGATRPTHSRTEINEGAEAQEESRGTQIIWLRTSVFNQRQNSPWEA